MCQNGHILLFIYNYFVIGNHFRVLFAILTNINITGTSTSTPTTVANAAPDCKPNREIATATANSKKLLAPIIPAGAAISWGNFHHLSQPYAMKNISTVFITIGTAIKTKCRGLFSIVSP